MSLIRYLSTIHSDELTDTDLIILKNIEDNLHFVPNSTISELSQKTFTSTTSLHRLVKKIGFDGFSEFKYTIENHLSDKKSQKTFQLNTNDYLEKLIEDIKITYKINEDKLEDVVKDIMSHNDVYCFGTGWKQKQIIDNFANDLLYYGRTLISLRNIDDLQLASKQLNDNSLVIIVSISGDLRGYADVMEYLHHKEIVTVGVTLFADNPLAEIVTHSLQFVDSSLQATDHHWSSIPLSSLLDQLSHQIAIQAK